MKFDLDTVSGRLKSARAELRISQAKLAKLADIATGTIGNLEVGTRAKPRELLNIAEALGVNAKWLATGTGERKPVAPVDSSGITQQEVLLVKMLRHLGTDKFSAVTREIERLLDPAAPPLTEAAVKIACEYLSYPPELRRAAAAGASKGMTHAVELLAQLGDDEGGSPEPAPKPTPPLPPAPTASRGASRPKRTPIRGR